MNKKSNANPLLAVGLAFCFFFPSLRLVQSQLLCAFLSISSSFLFFWDKKIENTLHPKSPPLLVVLLACRLVGLGHTPCAKVLHTSKTLQLIALQAPPAAKAVGICRSVNSLFASATLLALAHSMPSQLFGIPFFSARPFTESPADLLEIWISRLSAPIFANALDCRPNVLLIKIRDSFRFVITHPNS